MSSNSSRNKISRYRVIREFSSLACVLHWVRAFCIVALMVTGFYLAYPFVAPSNQTGEPTGFFYALARSWHLIIGFLLIAVTIFRVYLYFFDKDSRMERISWSDTLSIANWGKIISCYLLVGSHPHMKGSYNPLQTVTYTIIMLLIFAVSITGLILYANVYHEGLGGAIAPFMKSLEAMCGGLANVRVIHHILTWAFLIFIPVHIYMVFWNGARYFGSGADTIIGGIKFEKE